MPHLSAIEDDLGQMITEFLTAHDQYLLPNGTKMFVRARPAWCRICVDWVLAEVLEEPDEMEAGAREFCDKRKNVELFPGDFPKAEQDRMSDELLKKFLQEAAQWRLALRRRTSPPRCLDCGGCDFERLPENNGWMRHPAQPGRQVRIRPDSSFVEVSGRGNLYDTDGNRISGQRRGEGENDE